MDRLPSPFLPTLYPTVPHRPPCKSKKKGDGKDIVNALASNDEQEDYASSGSRDMYLS